MNILYLLDCFRMSDQLEANIPKEINVNDLKLSLITGEGYIDNISFKEKDVIGVFNLTDKIVRIVSNFGDILSSDKFDEINNKKKTTKSTENKRRGRKPLPKVKKQRKKLGEERVFHSQVEFFYHDDARDVIYRIKLFVNGIIQVPGVVDENFNDIKELLDYFVDYVNKIDCIKKSKEEDCKLIYTMSNMRNYATKLYFEESKEYKIDIKELNNVLNEYKKKDDCQFKLFLINYSMEASSIILKFLTPLPEFNQQMIEKYKPNYKKKNRQTTVIMFNSCKINVLGSNNREEVQIILNYLMNIFMENRESLFYKQL